MSAPERIQLRRTKGWRKPPNTVVVARPSRWGNPFRVVRGDDLVPLGDDSLGDGGRWHVVRDGVVSAWSTRALAINDAVSQFRWWATEAPDHYDRVVRHIAVLRGKNLACWCPLDQPCHADVLLELANPS